MSESLHCPACGYNLFGIDSPRCPECGLEIDRKVGVSRLPWTHRKRIGFLKAFFSTAVLASFHSRQIADEIRLPINNSDARAFRHVCVLLAWLPIMGLIAWPATAAYLHGSFRLVETMVGFTIVALGMWLYLLAITGVPSLFAYPRKAPIDDQNKAITLSYYPASAPLAWMFAPVVLIVASVIINTRNPVHGGGLFFSTILCASWALLAFIGFLLIGGPLKFLKHSVSASLKRRWSAAIFMPFSWIVLFYVIVVGIALAAGWIVVVYDSFH